MCDILKSLIAIEIRWSQDRLDINELIGYIKKPLLCEVLYP